MTSYREFEGKNIELAVKKACVKLKIDKERIKYKVISYGSTGIFWISWKEKSKNKRFIARGKKARGKKAKGKKD